MNAQKQTPGILDRFLIVLALFAAAALGAYAQDQADPFVEIATHSGSPLLLEVTIADPDHRVTAVTMENEVSVARYAITPDPESELVSLTLSPFLSPGVYDLVVSVEVEPEDMAPFRHETEARIGFVDWVYGRDNHNFGNNADYSSEIGTYGDVLISWLGDRFGYIDEVELIPVVDYMYGVFGKRSGRCYAFSGTELQLWLWPELLPSYYHDTYDLRGSSQRTQQEMNYLQLDMAFEHFLTGDYDLNTPVEHDPVSGRPETIRAEVAAAMSRIDDGLPVVVGFIGPALHHAMLVYGYIDRPGDGFTDLIVANNWKSDQDSNLRSTNAEAVRVYYEPRPAEPDPEDDAEDAPEDDVPVAASMFEWHYIGGTRDREIDRLFVVEVRQEYEHSRESLDALIDTQMDRLTQNRRAILVVEEAVGAALTDGESSTGYLRYRTTDDLEGVIFDKVNKTFRFDYPADADLWLEMVDTGGSQLLAFHPGDGPGDEIAWRAETEAAEDDSQVTRTVNLRTGDLAWEPDPEPESYP